jgi:hypothetical protein
VRQPFSVFIQSHPARIEECLVEQRTNPATGPADPTADGQVTFRPLPLGAARISSGFWAQRQRTNREVSIPEGATRLKEAGNYHNLALATGATTGDYRGPLFLDSDIYKWLEAVAWESGREPSAELTEWAREATEAVAAAQEPDGYLNSYVQAKKLERFADLPFGHELYCAGHLIQAAVADHRATGNTALLDIASHFADYLADTFGPGKLEGVCGHPEVETALVELYRETGKDSYLRLAEYFVDTRGHQTLHNSHRDSSYFQDRVPVRDATTVEGHAVRALYLAAGVADVYTESGDSSLLDALRKQWQHMVATKTYLTGGVGSRWDGEAFGDPYELPSDVAYCETCAAIASVQWSWRMLLATGAAAYADLIERTLYNAFLPGLSLSGDKFFYVNALQLRGDAGKEDSRSPAYGRRPWYTTACCPPNIMRTLSSLEHYLASTDADGIVLHQYAAGPLRAAGVALSTSTNYPWDGTIEITVDETPADAWTLSLRIPAWAQRAELTVNGAAQPAEPGGYARIRRDWRAGDRVVLELPMRPRLTVGDPRIDSVRGAVAIERGPLVYCFEQADQPAGVAIDDLRLTDGSLTEEFRPDLLGGVTVVRATARVAAAPEPGLPYGEPTGEPVAQTDVTVTAVPYFAWANRDIAAMRIWVPTAPTVGAVR